MSETKIPGIKAKHAIVTPICRANRGEGALDEALARLRRAYEDLVGLEANAGANFHLVLTVERPPSS